MRALALVLLLAAGPAAAQTRRSTMEALASAIAADPGFSAAERELYTEALRARFADYGLEVVRGPREDGVKVALKMVVEGQFDEAPAERVAAVAFAAYQAIGRGAPPEVVEGVALYGYRKQIPAERIAAWANGYKQMTDGGVPGEVAADLIRNAMERDWDDSAFNAFKWALVQGAKDRFDSRAYASYLFGHMIAGGKRPGALTAQARSYFKKLAKTGAKPVLPPYEGVFEREPTAPRPTEAQPPRAAPPAPAPAPAPSPAPSAPAPAFPSRAPAPAQGIAAAPPARAPAPPPAAPPAAPAAKAPPPKPAVPLLTASMAALWPGVDRSARSYLGTPYVWGGVTRKGIDCSALTQNSYSENSVRIPRVSRDQYKTGGEVAFPGLREGDLVFFNTLGTGVSHVGMVLDPRGGRFIHASSSRGVVIDDLSKSYYRARYLGARRVVH